MSTKKEFKELLTQDAKSGKLGRRDFMRFAVAAGMTIPLASGLWTSEVAAATPKRGGKFRLGAHDGNTSDNYDPGTYLSFAMIQLAHTHRSYLTMITPTNGLGPDMASSWSASDDASEWTFELDKNASFHSGKPFTAEDAIASLNHHRGEKTTSAAKALLADVVDIVKNNKHSITVKLSGGNADLRVERPERAPDRAGHRRCRCDNPARAENPVTAETRQEYRNRQCAQWIGHYHADVLRRCAVR